MKFKCCMLVFVLGFVSCETSVDKSKKELEVTLAQDDHRLKIETIGIDIGSSERSKNTGHLKLTQIAQVASPVVQGKRLQATSIVIKGSYAYVSYNDKGNAFIGAADILKINKGDVPQIMSTVYFSNADVNGIYEKGGKVYAALSCGYEYLGFKSPAALAELKIRGNQFSGGVSYLDLEGYAANSVYGDGNKLYVTTGDNGKLYEINRSKFAIENEVSVHDARWVHSEGKTLVTVSGTTDANGGLLNVFETDHLQESTLRYAFKGANIPVAKSTVKVIGGKALVAAGTGGVQLLDLETGDLLGSLPITNGVTNAVDANKKYVYISNGEAGVYVAEASEDLSKISTKRVEFHILGKLMFDDINAVNHVAYNSSYLFIADGEGGVRILRVESDESN